MTRSEAFHIREAFNRLNAIVVDLLKPFQVCRCSVCDWPFLRSSLGHLRGYYRCADCWESDQLGGLPMAEHIGVGNHHSSKDYDSHGIDKAVSYKLDHPEEYLT